MDSCVKTVGRRTRACPRPITSTAHRLILTAFAVISVAGLALAASHVAAQDPSIAIVSPAFAETFPVGTSDVTLSVEVSEHTGGWVYLVDASLDAVAGTEVASGSSVTLTGLTAGIHTVYVALVDDAGALIVPSAVAATTFLIGPELHEFDYAVPAGLSLFSAALAPYGLSTTDGSVSLATAGGVMRASHLIRLGSTVVISLQGGVFQTAVGRDGHIRFGDDFDVQPGHGYVVNFLDAVDFTMLGTPHGVSVGDVVAAPALDATNWAFALAGDLPDMHLLPADATMRVRNVDTGKTVPARVTADGRYVASLVDPNRRAVVNVGDLIRFEFVAADGYVLGSRSERRVTTDDMRLASLAANFSTRPTGARLLQNYPNPFNPETWIPFELDATADVAVRVYGIGGELVRQIDLGSRDAGYHVSRDDAAYWDGRNATGETVAGGVYLYELIAGDRRDIRRLVVLK